MKLQQALPLLALAAVLACSRPASDTTAATVSQITKTTYDYAIKDGDTLRLDVYVDPSVHYDGARPAIIFSFGGGWEAGTRLDGAGTHTPFLNTMTRYGYVCFGIDYRLGYLMARKNGTVKDETIGNLLASKGFTDTEYAATLAAIRMGAQDLMDATRFIIDNAARWDVDTSKIIISGTSAGAVNSLTAEYLLANSDSDATGRLPEGFNYAGVIAGCGALWQYAADTLAWHGKPCPVMFIHGTDDSLIPYGSFHNGTFSIYGSRALADTFNAHGWPYQLVTRTGAEHAFGGEPFARDQELIHRFITSQIIEGKPAIVEITETLIPNATAE